MVTKDIRNQTFEKGNAVQQFLYADSSCGLKQIAIAQKNNFHTNKDLYRKFALTVGDIILGFYKVEDTVPLLQQELALDPRAAALLGTDVLDFLAPLSDPQFVIPNQTEVSSPARVADVNLFTHTAAHIEPAVSVLAHASPILSVLTSNPAYAQPISPKRPGALPNPYTAPELRTMAADMAETSHSQTAYTPVLTNDAPVYSSQQPSVRTPLSELPTYHNPSAPHQSVQPIAPLEPPRWGA